MRASLTDLEITRRRNVVLDHVKANAGCKASQIAEAVGLGEPTVGKILDSLHLEGCVRFEREVRTGTGRRAKLFHFLRSSAN